MAGGFFSGLVTGTLISGGVLAVASVVAMVPGEQTTQASLTEVALAAPESPEDQSESDTGVNSDAANSDAALPDTGEAPEDEDIQSAAIVPVEPEPEAPEVIPEEVTPDPAEEEAQGGTIGNLAPEVTTDRLPSTGTVPEPEEEVEATEEDIATTDNLPPLEAFAVPFEAPEGKPLMSILLFIEAGSNIRPEALADFPYPLSFVIDVSNPDAFEMTQSVRVAGFEVLAAVDLPEQATPSDVEAAMQVYLEAVPGAVGFMEGNGTGLQSNRDAGAQLAPILLESGHGLVLHSRGLNTVSKLIAREGVPTATVFRDFDGQGQSSAGIRRFLDQAALRAGREEKGVVMMGRLRQETVNALLLWALQDKAEQVALAPISALLLAQ